MEIISDLENIPKLKKAALTIGVFDGVHIGHRKILSSMRSRSLCSSGDKECCLCVFTFRNHPNWVKSRVFSPRLISPPYYKLEVFEKEFGIDKVIFVRFSRSLQEMEPEEFLGLILSRMEQVDIFVGYNFRFGRMARGDTDFLIRNSSKLGYRAFVADEVTFNGMRVSSSIIRSLVLEGEIEVANTLLGRRFFLEGRVIRGKGIGSEIGFPTANIRARIQVHPSPGVYATTTEVEGKEYKSVTHVGESIVFGGSAENVETHILDFDENIYNKRIRVHFERFLGETRFVTSLKELKKIVEGYVEIRRYL